ncbi:hypothetical protein [Megasphaera sp. AM44-1BH]|jgi:hypothetical protein|uniref:hypothetical protein n=1 Tax=Megasphaera sp. AM44-1BH TaxID=2292358 RepID=UPI000E528189|nr:hypothetical protein [Megasphaera sp. AM44-1BH]RHA11808.1 hypothetical protein DW949_08640 [Megasphaera sp. AM44-1BH]
MMDIRILIGMPLWYAKSVLEGKNIPYVLEQTVSRSHFFTCDDQEIYVIRAVETDGVVHLLYNYSLKASDSVQQALHNGE